MCDLTRFISAIGGTETVFVNRWEELLEGP